MDKLMDFMVMFILAVAVASVVLAVLLSVGEVTGLFGFGGATAIMVLLSGALEGYRFVVFQELGE
jgi:uncharacterized RDD family membrane protein YckC